MLKYFHRHSGRTNPSFRENKPRSLEDRNTKIEWVTAQSAQILYQAVPSIMPSSHTTSSNPTIPPFQTQFSISFWCLLSRTIVWPRENWTRADLLVICINERTGGDTEVATSNQQIESFRNCLYLQAHYPPSLIMRGWTLPESDQTRRPLCK